MKRLWSCLLVAAICLTAPRVSAEVTRYAVIAGNNVGLPGEAPLEYAEADAEKVFEVLGALGDFRRENMLLLQGRGAGELSRALISMNARIRAESSAGRDAVLFVYYSGHGDKEALHLGPEALEVGMLQRLVQGSAADFRVLVLDACRSGALTRPKGGRRTAPFPIVLEAELSFEGFAVLTSSAADEDAQESDALRGSFFTHYLVSGLRGAADRDGDGTVSVEEAYAHAYQHTLRASSQSLLGMQHPTFRFDLEGRGAVPLSWYGRRDGSVAHIGLPPGRAYVLFAGGEHGPVVAEVGQYDARRLLALEAGAYFVRGRAADHLLEGLIALGPGQTLELDESQLGVVEYARLARKGGSERAWAHGLWLGYQARSALWATASFCHGPRAGYHLDLPEVTVGLAFGACRSQFDNAVLSARADELGGEASAAHVWDLSRVSVSVGIALGASWLRERFQTRGRAPARDTFAFSGGALIGASLDVSHGYHMLADALGEALVFEQSRPDAASAMIATPVLRVTLGAGKRF